MAFRPTFRILVLLFAFAAAASVAQEQPQPQPIPVPVYLDGRYLGEVDAVLAAEAVLLAPSQVVALVSDILTDRVLDDARSLFPSERPVAPGAFAPLGMNVSFDWDELLVRLEVPPLIRRPQRISLAGRRSEPRGTRIPTADFSLITNLDLWTRYAWEARLFEIAATPEVAANIHGAVLEVQGGFRTGESPFFLDHARATYDLVDLGYRVQVGDLTWRATELAGVQRVTGLSLFREGSLGGPTGMTELVLESIYLPTSSRLSIAVNESERYASDQPAGNYEIADVPLGDGLNVVTISWESDDGPRQVDLVIPHDGDLLEAGELDAGVALGVANREIVRPVVSAYQRYGLTRALTLGLREGVEALDFQVDVGGEAMLATRIGTFVIDPSVGIGPTNRLLIDAPLRYYYLDSGPSSYLSFGVSGGYRSLTATDGALTQLVTAAGHVNFILPEGFSITPTVSNLYSLTEGANRLTVRTSLRKSIRGGSALSANIGFEFDGEPSLLATVTYSASFPERRQNLFLQQNLNTQELFAFWSRYPGESEHEVDFNVSTKVPIDTAQVANLSGQFGYTGRAFQASAAHALAGVVSTGDLRNATSLSLQSALAYADGLVAISVPIADSFTIVAPGGSLAGTEVAVSRAGSQTELVLTDRAGVLPGLASYTPVQIDVEPTVALRGVDERELRFVVDPTWRSGTVIRAEPTLTVYAGGVLLGPGGEPVEHALGTWSGRDGSGGEFFTDGEGYFELYGLRPGSYDLALVLRPGTRASVTIPDDAGEFVDLGDVRAEETTP